MKEWIPQDAQKWLGMGLEMAVSILGGVFCGYIVDRTFGFSPYGILSGAVLGFAIALYSFIKEASKINKNVQ